MSTADQQPDPWAQGGSMSTAADGPSADFEFDVAPPTAAGRPRFSRRQRVAASVAVLVVAAAGITVAATRSGGADDASGDAANRDDPAAEESAIIPLPTTPPTVETLPDAASADADLADDEQGPTTIQARTSTERLVDAAPQRIQVIDVPSELADIAPTEIVGLHSTEGVYEISLPSGRLRVTALDYFVPQGAGFAVNDAGVMVWPTPEGGSQLIGVDRSIGVRDGALAGVATTTGSNSFTVWPQRSIRAGSTGTAGPQVITLRSPADTGDVSTGLTIRDTEQLGGTDPRALAAPGGGLVIADTGGSYLATEDGTTRLTSGDVIATGRNHLLIRECDQQRECSLASLDANGFRTLWAIDLPDDVNPQRINGLSPAGDALVFNGLRISADAARELRVLELANGSVTRLGGSTTSNGDAAWANDGSGVFSADTQLRFLPRDGGPAVVIAPDLGQLRTVVTRQPASTPVCELLSAVLPRFDQMEASDDDTVAPPSVLVLNRLIDVAPESLSLYAQPLVTFVGAFVSAETPDSQVVANWPTDVRTGLSAMRKHDLINC